MFGMKRRRATKAAIAATRPLIGVRQYLDGIPRGFWDDPYVIGFICFTAVFNAKQATNQSLTGEKLAFAVINALTEISNINGLEIFKTYGEYGLARPKNPDFERALDNAVILNTYVMDMIIDEEKIPNIVDAKEFVRRAGDDGFFGGGEREKVVAYLLKVYWSDELEKRFDEGGESYGLDATDENILTEAETEALTRENDVKTDLDENFLIATTQVLKELGYKPTLDGIGHATLNMASDYNPVETASLIAHVTLAQEVKNGDQGIDTLMSYLPNAMAMIEVLRHYKDLDKMREDLFENDSNAILGIVEVNSEQLNWIEKVLSDSEVSDKCLATRLPERMDQKLNFF